MGPLRVAQRLVPHGGDDALDLVVVTLHGECASTSTSARSPAVTVAVVRRRVDQAHGERRVVADERQPGGAQQLVAGDLPAGRDPPQGDLHDVLAPPRPVRLDDVGQLRWMRRSRSGGSRSRSTSP